MGGRQGVKGGKDLRLPQPPISVEEYRQLQVQPGRSKYGAHAIVYEGVRYHSKAELAFELHLRQLKVLGKVAWWVRQVPFSLPGGGATERAQRYLLDFLVQAVAPGWTDNVIAHAYNLPPPVLIPRLVDVKGVLTPTSATKISVVQATYGVKIELVKPKDVDSWI